MSDQLSKCKNYILSLLSYRQYSKKEIYQKLKKKEYEYPIINQAILDLERVGLIDDQKFAQGWIYSRMHTKPRGKFLLIRELKEKGVEKRIIDSTLKKFDEEYDEFEIAKDLAIRKMKSSGNIETGKMKRRIFGFLQRRGFSYDVIKYAMNNLIEDYEEQY